MKLSGGIATVALALLLGCGDNSEPADALPPLLEDPAVETGCTSVPTAGQARAKRVECEAELATGRMAAGREGDLLLENELVRVIIRGPGDGFYLYGTSGGAVIDAARHGADDLIQEIVPLLELNTGRFSEIVIVEAGDSGPAEIAVRGIAEPAPLFASTLGTPAANIVVEQRYRLAPGETAVTIETRVYPQPDTADPAPVIGLIDTLFFGGRLTLAFPGQDDDATRGPFMASSGPNTSYAIVLDPDSGASMTLVELAFFELLELPTISVGDETLTRYLVIGDGSMSSVVDRGWQLYGEATTTVSGATAGGVDVVARTESGAVASAARSDETGAFSFALRPGSYTLTAEATDRAPGEPVAITVAGAAVEQDLTAGPRGSIELTTTADGTGAVARVTITGTGPSAGFRRERYSDADGAITVGVPPGTYTVDVSKGMEYTAFTATDVVVPADGEVTLTAPVTRALTTDGWISVDPHLHSEMSIDSSVPLDERLLSVAGEGVEVAVSSDHDFIVDYGPIVSELGLSGRLFTMPGQESTSLLVGHINAWPTPLDPDRPGGGALPWYGNGPRTIFDLARDGDAGRIVQVNHPWDPLGLFTLIGFDRATLMATKTGADLGIPGENLNDFSFDALEVGNKKTEGSFEQAFGDWLALVTSGLPIAATGASDSHGDDAYAGEARTYVFVGDGNDDPSSISAAAINDAIRSQRAVVAQGIFVVAGVVGQAGVSLPGELVDGSAQAMATVRISVQAPPWLPVSNVVIYERDTEIMRIPIDISETQAVRFEGEVDLPLDSRDTLFVVAAEPGGDGRPVMEQPKPSFANPLYIDRNGNGQYDAE